MSQGLFSAGFDPAPWFPGGVLKPAPRRRAWDRLRGPLRRWLASLPFHLLLFALTVATTVVVGTHIAANFSRGLQPFDWEFSAAFFRVLVRHPSHLLPGVPFSFTLLGILLAHELGHYIACRHHGLRASYPYFVPAPTLIGTLGAFIRIKSPFLNRRALFDVGVAGPLAGFVVAIPALAIGVLQSKVFVAGVPPGAITFGSPLALMFFERWLHPGVPAARLLLSPVAAAAWVGLFATALNLLPAGQLDGGHILYALLGDKHKMVSRGLWLALLPLGFFCWAGWFVWALLLLILGLRHPMLVPPPEPLSPGRRALALVAALIFILSFAPTPFSVQ